MTVDWGSVPDWLAGCGAVAALVFAGAAVRAAYATNEQQSKQIAALQQAETERVEDRRARYASKLTVWITLAASDDEGNEFDRSKPAVALVNANEVPMYRVTVYAGTPLGIVWRLYNYVGPLTGRRIMGRPTRAIHDILPDQRNSELLDSGTLWAAVTFRDPAGTWWYRNPAGELHSSRSESTAEDECRRSLRNY